MQQVPLYFPFTLAVFFALFGSVFLPYVHLLVFSPFLGLLYTRCNFVKALWIASLCGFVMDLLSSEFRFGIQALAYALTTLLLYKQKKHFFEDKPLALSLFTLLISIVSTLCQWSLISLFDRALPLSGKFLFTDLVVMPLVDAGYAFLWFSCPMMLFLHLKKKGWRNLLKPFLDLFINQKLDANRNDPSS
jgi:rod shape-determining protein MreD